MKKTIDIHLAGLRFHLDEDAYFRLNEYLESLRKALASTLGSEEILSDIEGRIAELFHGVLTASKQVIALNEVDRVIALLGKPEEYVDSADAMESVGKPETKRLFRDPDDQIIGGVASGISAYFSIDPVIIRVIMALLFFVGGFGAGFYILLWIVIPEAKSTSDRLRMRGEKITWQNIQKTVHDELDGVANRASRFTKGQSFRQTKNKAGQVVSEAFDSIGQILMYILHFVAKAIGVVLMIVSISVGISVAVILFGEGINVNGALIAPQQLQTLVDVFAPAGFSMTSLVLLLILLLLGPIFGIFSLGARILFNIPWKTPALRLLNGGATLLFISATILLFYFGSKTGREFHEEASITRSLTLPTVQRWSVVAVDAPIPPVTLEFSFNEEEYNSKEWVFTEDHVYTSLVYFDVVPSADGKARVDVQAKANGSTRRSARERAGSVGYNASVDSAGKIALDSYLSFAKQDRFRGQNIQVTLYLPIGHSVYLDPSSIELIYDIENVENVYDADMVGQWWLMTEVGLVPHSSGMPLMD